MGDPLLRDGVDLVDTLIVAGKLLIVFGVLLLVIAQLTWVERKVVADMQNRIGPNRTGKWGLLQAVADGVKLMFKEELIPAAADRRVFLLAPYLAVVPAFVSFSVIPLGEEAKIFGRSTYLQLADPPIGVLLILAMSGLGVYGVMLAGWSSGSKYPLLGAVRASAQVISYEAALGLAIVGVLLHTGSLSTRAIVEAQAWDGPASVLRWFVVQAPVPFAIFLVAMVAEVNRPPFDLVEAEQELVGGFHTEYSGMRFAIFYLAEYLNSVTMSALAVTLFLGGPAGPGLPFVPLGLSSVMWFVLKVCLLLFCFIWLRAALPRLRYDQLMDLGWRLLIPTGLLWLGVSAVYRTISARDWPAWGYLAAPAGALLVYGFLRAAMPKRESAAGLSIEMLPGLGRHRKGGSR